MFRFQSSFKHIPKQTQGVEVEESKWNKPKSNPRKQMNRNKINSKNSKNVNETSKYSLYSKTWASKHVELQSQIIKFKMAILGLTKKK